MAVRVVVMLGGQNRDFMLDVAFETVRQAVLQGSWIEDVGNSPNLRCSIDPDEVAAIFEVNV